jgi:hypothetical protein
MNKTELTKIIKDYGKFRIEAETLEDLESYETNLINVLNEAINYTHSCEELPTSAQLLSDCKKRFKELEAKGNLDFRSYKNGYYLDSLSKNVISKIK